MGAVKGKPFSLEHRRKISEGGRGVRRSAETRQRISDASKRRWQNPEYRRRMSEAKKRHWQNSEYREKMLRTWTGRKHTDAARQKVSAARTGKPLSAEHRASIGRGQLGRKHTAETRARQSAGLRGKERSLEHRANLRKANLGKHLSAETRAKLSERGKGSGNSNWRGGIAFLPYASGWTVELRRSIRARDGYACRLCGKLQDRVTFDVHHIDYDKTHCDHSNLVTLCDRCHGKTTADREYWMAFFRQLITDETVAGLRASCG